MLNNKLLLKSNIYKNKFIIIKNLYYYNMYILWIFFIIILIIYYILINYFYKIKIKNNNKINFNLSSGNLINKVFKNELDKRLELLQELSYDEWINYNMKNNYIKINNFKYYFFIYENIEQSKFIKSTFVNRVNEDKNIQNMSIKDIIQTNQYKFIFTKYKSDSDFIDNIFLSKDKYKKLTYYWYDPDINSAVKKFSISKNFSKNNIDGIIGLDYDISILEDDFSLFYNLIDKYSLFFLIFIIFFAAIIINFYDISNLSYTSIILLLISNIYIFYYLGLKEENSNFDIESDKFKFLSDSLLSVSFLIGINVFILTNIKSFCHISKNNLFFNSVIIFCLSLILLLRSLYKTTNYETIESMKKIRITKQLFFNIAVILNVFIIINYFIFIILTTEKKIFKKFFNL
jgi:hypothetical protein